MAFDETLGRRIAAILEREDVEFREKRMFGGLAFMIHDKMCVGIVNDSLMLRVMEDEFERVLKMADVRPMDFNGKPMKGFVFVDPVAFRNDAALSDWLRYGLEFAENGEVKSRKKKTAA